MQATIDVLSWACILAGAFFTIAGAAGMLRLPDFYTRSHAASVCDTFGAGLIMVGLMLQGGLSLVTVKLLLILYFVLFTGPTATHALAAAAVRSGLQPVTVDRERQP